MTELSDFSKFDAKETQEPVVGNEQMGQERGAKLPQYLVTLTVTILAASAGMALGWSSPALKTLLSDNSDVSITFEQASWIGSLLPVGAFLGALPAGKIADSIGRKLSALGMAVPYLLSWILIYFASSPILFYIGRLIAGLGIGATCAVVPMYIAEIAEDTIRGTLGSIFQLMLVVGILYIYVTGAILPYNYLPIVCGIFPLVFLLAFFKAPESPIYLLKKDKRQKAEIALKFLRGKSSDIYKELHSLENELTNNSGVKIPFLKAISNRASIKGLIICIGSMVFQQMCGINIVIFYIGQIFQEAGSSLDSDIAAILVSISQLIATLFSVFLIDRAGRKILLQISSGVMAICLGGLGYYFFLKNLGEDVSSLGMIPLLSIIVYIVIFSIGFGPIPWMMASEVLSSDIKGIGSGIAVALSWFLAFVVTKTFQNLLDTFGAANTYWIFSFICIVGVIFVSLFVIETKGKSLAQIQNELSGKPEQSYVNNYV